MLHVKWDWHTLTSPLRRVWWNTLGEPFAWLFLCFFQPARFKEEFEYLNFSRRFTLILRLAIPLLLLSFFIALPVQMLLLSGIAGTDPVTTVRSMFLATVLGVACGLIVGTLEDIGIGMILGLALGITGMVVGNTSMGFIKGIAVAVALGLVGGTGRGVQWGKFRGVLGGVLGGLFWAIASSMTQGPVEGLTKGIWITAAFLLSYNIVGYYRLLLYLASGPSGLWAYYASRKNPSDVFAYLHRSSLYWDENVFLPLPNLQRTLMIAVGQDVQQALKEIAFIIDKRPQQQQAALATLCEIALRDMETRESLRDIATAVQRLNELLPQKVMFIEPRLMVPFTRLADASREAARYHGPLSWQTKRTALEEMLKSLGSIYANTAFPDARLNTLLSNVVANWRNAVKYEQEKLEQGAGDVGQIMNPYNPGNTLKPHDTLFVGRRDVVRQLSEALSKGSNRPTFLLNGERRMGKSSTLRQLPNLLGASYIPVFYDLQDRGISSSIDMFLARLAEQIYKDMSMRGMSVRKIERARLQEARQRNEAAVYHPFDEWLDDVESILAREHRTLLLLFDEFEKLEEAAADGYLNLNLVLDWFRKTIQNRSHVALLFSGVRTFGEMGANWAGYFVNAKVLKVSFLRLADTRHLITQPVPNFPSQELFGEGVVDEIIRMTSCHPFLVQAVCSELIDHLNVENRERAELADVAIAVMHVLDNWWDTYFRDLWERTDQQQRVCLVILSQGEEYDLPSLVEQSDLDEQTLRQTLQTLLKRDLVLLDKHTYRIASPIFSCWVERNR